MPRRFDDASQGSAQPYPEDATGFGRNGRARDPLFWTVETASGRVEGIANGHIKQFRGVPYGASTGGANRFQPPRRPTPWSGVRDCIGYGQVAPQAPMDLTWAYGELLHWDAHVGPGGMGEDCLNLNIWTPGVDDGRRRPVLVALHGGGWVTGSGNGPMYDGARLAAFGDVVVVTVNHRLGALGYAHLGALGGPPELAQAGVCGMLDLVAALEWVRENIEAFGGDPHCILAFGHSGGGWKTSALMAMPLARGLFHRAGVQSGAMLRLQSGDEGALQAERLLRELGLGRDRVAEVLDVSWQRLLTAQAAIAGDFRPVVDGGAIPRHPFDPSAPEESQDVPLIVGTTLHDWSNMFENFDVDDSGVLQVFRKSWGDRAEAILSAYRAENPTETAFLIQGSAYTDASRGNAMLQVQRKAVQGGAPAYLYQWDWAPHAFDGRYGAVHGSDLEASFRLHRSPMAGSGASEGRLMSDRIAATWVAFARTGSPANPLIPHWPRYDEAARATMVFDREMRVVNDCRGDFVRLIGETGPPTAREAAVGRRREGASA
jgi:para-nitrobenzyl esterase